MGKSKSTKSTKKMVDDTPVSDNQAAVDEVEASAETEESIDNSELAEVVESSESADAADNEEFVTTNAYVDRVEETENGGGRIVLYTYDEDNPEKFVLPASMTPKDIKPDDSVIVKIIRN